MIKIKTRVAIAVCALLFCFGAFLAFWRSGFELPPCILPPGNYDEAAISTTKLDLMRLLPLYSTAIDEYWRRGSQPSMIYMNTDPKYFKMVDDVVGQNPSPEDLAMLAIWAEQKDPWFYSQNHIYSIVFYRNLYRLAKMQGPRAAYALWKIRQFLVTEIHFDGHLAESIIEAQDQQRGGNQH